MVIPLLTPEESVCTKASRWHHSALADLDTVQLQLVPLMDELEKQGLIFTLKRVETAIRDTLRAGGIQVVSDPLAPMLVWGGTSSRDGKLWVLQMRLVLRDRVRLLRSPGNVLWVDLWEHNATFRSEPQTGANAMAFKVELSHQAGLMARAFIEATKPRNFWGPARSIEELRRPKN
jgi:hypothetical protein